MRFLYLFLIIVFFSVLWSIYSTVYSLPEIGVESTGEEYINKVTGGNDTNITYTPSGYGTIIGDLVFVLTVLKTFFTTLICPSVILSGLGIPGSFYLGIILNLVVWFIEVKTVLELMSGGRKL